MDLKDVVESVRQKAIEVHNAFHAGHGDVAEKYLQEISETVVAYLVEKKIKAGDVTKPATSVKPEETSQATLAQPPGPAAQAAAVVPAANPSKVQAASQFVKPNQ